MLEKGLLEEAKLSFDNNVKKRNRFRRFGNPWVFAYQDEAAKKRTVGRIVYALDVRRDAVPYF